MKGMEMIHQRWIRRGLSLAFLGLIAGFAPGASAHLMPAGKGTVNIVGAKAYMVVSLPLAAFTIDGQSADGLAGAVLARRKASLLSQLKAGVSLASGDQPGRVTQAMVNLPKGRDHRGDAGQELVGMLVVEFAAPPHSLRVSSTLWAEGSDGLALKVTESEGPRTLRAELVQLSAAHPDVLVFASAEETFLASFKRALSHLVVGWDHLLLFLLLFVMRFSVRRWVGLTTALLTGFAVAFLAVANEWFALDAHWVEWGIGVSVFLVAGLLWWVPTEPDQPLWWRWQGLWVGALGGLHGLGFAMVTVQPGTSHRLELKALSVAAALVVVCFGLATLTWGVRALGSRSLGGLFERALTVATNLSGAALGLFWVVERSWAL